MVFANKYRTPHARSTVAATFLAASALVGCSGSTEKHMDCFSVPTSTDDKAFEKLVQDYSESYDIVNKRIAAALIKLGIEDDELHKFDNWRATSSDIRTELYEQHAKKDASVSPLDIPKNTDTFAFSIVWDKDGSPHEGGRILPFMDGTKAFTTLNERESYINFTGSATQIDCQKLTPIKILGE